MGIIIIIIIISCLVVRREREGVGGWKWISIVGVI